MWSTATSPLSETCSSGEREEGWGRDGGVVERGAGKLVEGGVGGIGGRGWGESWWMGSCVVYKHVSS